MELGRIDDMSLEDLKKEVSQLKFVEDGFEFTVSRIKPWLDTRKNTFHNITLSLNTETGMIVGDKTRQLLREYVVMEQILKRVRQDHAHVSKGWLAQAKRNLEDSGSVDDAMVDKMKKKKKLVMKKIPASTFMGRTDGKRPRVPPAKKELPGCARCGGTTGYNDKQGKLVATMLTVEIGTKQTLQVCRACLKIANVQAAIPHDTQVMNMKDRIKVHLSKHEGETFLKNKVVRIPNGKASLKEKELATCENKGQGTDADPILLSSSDDEDGDAKKQDVSPRCKAVVNPCQRQTRRSSKIETDSILDTLKCSMPPKGGLGAVIFMLRDYMKLRPFEFMNDSCIDYFFKSLEAKLKEENPEKGERCYFFNSFFYKKLTDDTASVILSDETKALADGPLAELDKLSLQALMCYDVTKRWTKNVDLFSKDFLFIPIHDQLHWSLVIVCHPGSGKIRGNEANGPEAFMLHLDSMSAPSGHNSDSIGKLIKRYLQNEWKAKLQQDCESVPKMWVQEHPDETRNFLKMVMRRPQVPMQENHYDCGSFVCAFLDHFIAALPKTINAQMVPFHRKSRLFPKKKNVSFSQPMFLTRKWFEPKNASNLRHHLAITVLKAMAVNAGVMDDHGRWVMENLSQEQQHKMTFLIHTLETLNSEDKYSPPSWSDVPDDCVDDDDDDGNDTEKTNQSDIQEIDASQPSDPIEDALEGMDPIKSIDDEELEIDIETVDVIKEAPKGTPCTPADDRAKLRQIKKRKDLRNTPDVDVIAQCHDGGEIEVFSQDSPVKFSKRKNKFAKKSKPSMIGRSPRGATFGLAESYKGMPQEGKDKIRNFFLK